MTVSFDNIILWTFSVMLVAIGIAQLAFNIIAAGGWASIAIGTSLIAVAASTRKKNNNG